MYCMKCGKETQEDQVFCERCLTVMDAYPVKPDVAIQLPNRQHSAAKKAAPRKRIVLPEEQVEQLRKANRGLIRICLVFALLLIISTGIIVYQATRPKTAPTPTTNRNYTYAPDAAEAD